MTRHVQCLKLGIKAEGLPTPPFPGELGLKIYEHISQQAWQQWLNQQTILINENRLSLLDPSAQALLLKEMERYLFNS